MHISDECFVPFGVSVIFPKESVYADRINIGILRMQQSGIINKLERDVKWDMQRSSTGKLLQANYLKKYIFLIMILKTILLIGQCCEFFKNGLSRRTRIIFE